MLRPLCVVVLFSSACSSKAPPAGPPPPFSCEGRSAVLAENDGPHTKRIELACDGDDPVVRFSETTVRQDGITVDARNEGAVALATWRSAWDAVNAAWADADEACIPKEGRESMVTIVDGGDTRSVRCGADDADASASVRTLVESFDPPLSELRTRQPDTETRRAP